MWAQIACRYPWMKPHTLSPKPCKARFLNKSEYKIFPSSFGGYYIGWRSDAKGGISPFTGRGKLSRHENVRVLTSRNEIQKKSRPQFFKMARGDNLDDYGLVDIVLQWRGSGRSQELKTSWHATQAYQIDVLPCLVYWSFAMKWNSLASCNGCCKV